MEKYYLGQKKNNGYGVFHIKNRTDLEFEFKKKKKEKKSVNCFFFSSNRVF